MVTLVRYALVLLVASIVQQTLVAGSITSGLIGGVIAFAWVGWMGALAGLPLLAALVLLLPRASAAFPDAPQPMLATALSAAIWLVALVALAGLPALTAHEPQQPADVLGGAASFVGLGGAIGLVEGLARWRASARSATPVAG